MAERRCNCARCLIERDERIPGLEFIPPHRIRMVLCAVCGNKRCPHASDHRNACTGSNDPGQPGSYRPYGDVSPPLRAGGE